MGAYRIVRTPYFVALNWAFSKGVRWLLAAWSLGLAILLVRVMAHLVTTRRPGLLGELSGPEADALPPAPERRLRELITL